MNEIILAARSSGKDQTLKLMMENAFGKMICDKVTEEFRLTKELVEGEGTNVKRVCYRLGGILWLTETTIYTMKLNEWEFANKNGTKGVCKEPVYETMYCNR